MSLLLYMLDNDLNIIYSLKYLLSFLYVLDYISIV